MTWKMETGPDGLPVWSGVDSARHMLEAKRAERWSLVTLGGSIGAVVAAFALASAATGAIFSLRQPPYPICPPSPDGWCWWLLFDGLAVVAGVGLLLLLAALGAVVWFLLRLKPSPWIVRPWTLAASPDGLTYQAEATQPALADMWGRVSLAEVARVEVGLTGQWVASRLYASGDIWDWDGHNAENTARKVPDAEFQTFLFMADGSRRVIYTVNGNREAAATLAHSVRSWLDAHRSASPSIAAPIAAPALGVERGVDGRYLGTVTPAAEGFDL